MTGFKDSIERLLYCLPRTPPPTQSTYCPNLWTDAFIDDKGRVYGCCHTMPFRLGNLHAATLEEIWNGWRWRSARALSLGRILPCYDRCRLLDAEARATRPVRGEGASAPYARLRRIKILFGELCNIRCVMCPQDHRSTRQLSVGLLKRSVDFTHIESIEIQGGEPLAMKECKAAYRWLTEDLGKKVNFLTNGTLISEVWAERIARGSDWLYVSVNGVEPETIERVSAGLRYDRLVEGIRRLQEARTRLGCPLELVGSFTIVPENIREVARFPDLCKRLGLDRAEFGYDIVSVPRWCDDHPEEAARIRDTLQAILADPPVPFRDHRFRALGLVS